MNIGLSDCSKETEKNAVLKLKRMQSALKKNRSNKPQPNDLEPSKAWIKNMGIGTTKELTKLKTKRSNTTPHELSKPAASLPSSPPLTPPTPPTANKKKIESVTASKPNDIQYGFGEKTMDNTTVSVLPNNRIDVGAPVEPSEQSIGYVTGDNDSSNYQTCIEIDTTLVNTDLAETIVSKPIAPRPRRRPPHSETIENFKHFPIELSNFIIFKC